MSIFGQRIAAANALVDAEFGDDFLYWPHKEIVGAEPVPDDTRPYGTVHVIILQPGITLGSGYGLQSMMARSSSDITLWYMARDLLGDNDNGTSLKKFDRFLLLKGLTNPDKQQAYEVANGPMQVGFGRWKTTVVEIDWPEDHPPLPEPQTLLMNPLNRMSAATIKKRLIARGLDIK